MTTTAMSWTSQNARNHIDIVNYNVSYLYLLKIFFVNFENVITERICVLKN